MSTNSGIDLILAYFWTWPVVVAQLLHVAVTPSVKSEVSELVVG
jgi:hypothetical protein